MPAKRHAASTTSAAVPVSPATLSSGPPTLKTNASAVAIAQNVWEQYAATTPQRTLLLDAFMAFLVLVGGLQFLYCVLAGNYVRSTPSSILFFTVDFFRGEGMCRRNCAVPLPLEVTLSSGALRAFPNPFLYNLVLTIDLVPLIFSLSTLSSVASAQLSANLFSRPVFECRPATAARHCPASPAPRGKTLALQMMRMKDRARVFRMRGEPSVSKHDPVTRQISINQAGY